MTRHGKRGTKANPIEGEHQLFGFLTTDANAEVGAIHPKAMPVILTQADQVDAWLTLPVAEALQMQKPLPDGALKIVARGEKEGGATSEPVATHTEALDLPNCITICEGHLSELKSRSFQ